MMNAFEPYGAMIGLVLVIWFFYMGFLLKKIIKEQEETNRLLRASGGPGSASATSQK